MKRFILTILCASIFGIAPPQTHAQASFLLGMAAGAVLFDDGTQHGGSSPSVLYTLAYASERVIDPLEIKLVVTPPKGFTTEYPTKYNAGKSLRSLFHENVKNAEAYVILQAVRIQSFVRAYSLDLVYLHRTVASALDGGIRKTQKETRLNVSAGTGGRLTKKAAFY